MIHEPYVTTKHGKLRSKRKSKNEPISATDDLATLENPEEVRFTQTMTSGIIFDASQYMTARKLCTKNLKTFFSLVSFVPIFTTAICLFCRI